MRGNLFHEKKRSPAPLPKSALTKLQKRISNTRIDGRRKVKPRFCYRERLGTTKTPSAKRVVWYWCGSTKALPYRLPFW